MMTSPTPAAPQAGIFARLPAELLGLILDQLSNSQRKSLRLVCRFLRDTASLRLNRVFISANPRNIEVLRAIADHEAFRNDVTEIIWDDARLGECEELFDPGYGEFADVDFDPDDLHVAPWPLWFEEVCHTNQWVSNTRMKSDKEHPAYIARAKQFDAQMPISQSWDLYQQLLQQQDKVLSSRADEEALKYGLRRFPSLRRITITPAAHGFLFEPLYETPMIRSFPYGFNYPIPRGWPATHSESRGPKMLPWNDENEDVKERWRGFRIVTRVLAQTETKHHVSELILDAHQLNTGLHCRIFDQPCAEQDDLAALIRRPGFRRLDLSLSVGGQEGDRWCSYRSGHMRRILANAADLEHISLRTNVVGNPEHRRGEWNRLPRSNDEISGGTMDHFNPLHAIFPVEKWQRLHHFGLSGSLVTQDDVFSFLSTLPGTVRSVELSFLMFLDHGGNYRDLLYDMREKLGWRKRPAHERPRVTIEVDMPGKRQDGRSVSVSDDVHSFLYGESVNPFGTEKGEFPNKVLNNRVARDQFDPAYERPR
ncbi:hypothetical protein B0J13DRAFT_579688 [Dactylonectria estremocensis]|uniref:F-box domain-containing protein n=1 Tax=Dactylonectria estremocensis TaxID=1079267 RepID=A0A9P9CXA2_9HYPO|nr:hypothetical protein B0J13DRAFT_579688 [Dactylonectria estremocensis]